MYSFNPLETEGFDDEFYIVYLFYYWWRRHISSKHSRNVSINDRNMELNTLCFTLDDNHYYIIPSTFFIRLCTMEQDSNILLTICICWGRSLKTKRLYHNVMLAGSKSRCSSVLYLSIHAVMNTDIAHDLYLVYDLYIWYC